MSQFAKGTSVKQIVTPIAGTVQGFQVDQETGDVLILVSYVETDGAEHQRYFKADELTAA